MDRVVQGIREQKPEYDIQIDSMNARGLVPSIKFTVQQQEYKEPALQMIVSDYESRMQRLETDKDRLAALLAQSLENNRLQAFLLTGAVERIGDNIHAEAGAVVATGNASINIEQNIHYAELRKAIEDDETLGQVAKRKALDVIGGAIQDFAKGQVKEAAKQIYELGKDLGPVIVNTAAYGFFKSCLGL
jgi:hypothetical protein